MFLWSRATDCDAVSDAMAQTFGGQRFLVHRQVQPTLRMTLPSTYAAMEARLSRNFRSDLRRKIRRLGEQAELHHRVAATRDEIRERFPNLVALHRAEWRGRSQLSDFDDEKTEKFYTNIINELPLGLLLYSELRLGEKVVSARLMYLFDNVLRDYKSAYDLQVAKFSPGKAHIARIAEWGIERNISAIDFMEGLEDYKYRWANAETDCVTHAVSPVAGFPLWMWNTKIRKLIVAYKV
jgi:CelD/BcsL family acetyltransferase involved in cellulose biosynthesis